MISLIDHQIKPFERLRDHPRPRSGKLILADAGSGKTFVIAKYLAEQQRLGVLPLETNKLASVLYLCPKSNVIQTKRVLASAGVENVLVTSHASMRATLGENFLQWVSSVKHGQMAIRPIWSNEELPDLIVNDECQNTKNPLAQCSLVLESALEQGSPMISMSATPFVRVCEARLIAVSCGLCSFDGWPHYSNYTICGGRVSPEDRSPAAIARLRQALENHDALITFENIKWPFKAQIRTKLIPFDSVEDERFYKMAYERYLRKLRENGGSEPTNILARWRAQQEFKMAAELLRAERLAVTAFQKWKEGKQPIIAACYLATLDKVWTTLVQLGVKPEQISCIKGAQTEAQTQEQVDLFNIGRNPFLLGTLGKGGVGLSMHHFHPKASPRYVCLPLTWSIYQVVQMLGRAQRINSLSSTEQEILGYENSIEGEEILPRLEENLRCLKELLNRKDNFISNIFQKGVDKDLADMDQREIEEILDENSGEFSTSGIETN